MLVSFPGMVVYDVENDLNASAVQLFHHGSKLIQANQWIVAGAVTQMRSKERHWPISPVIVESERCVLRVKLKHRQEFYGGDSQLMEIEYLFDESKISAPSGFNNARIRVSSESGHVHFVYHCSAKRMLEWPVSFPVEST